MHLTLPRNLPTPGRRQPLYIVLIDFAETCVFGKQSHGPILCDPITLHGLAASRYAGYLFSRSYEVILPSSLARVVSRTLVSSTNLPVAVYGTDSLNSRVRRFSWQCGVNIFCSVEHPHHASVSNGAADFPTSPTYTLKQSLPVDCMSILLRHSALYTN